MPVADLSGASPQWTPSALGAHRPLVSPRRANPASSPQSLNVRSFAKILNDAIHAKDKKRILAAYDAILPYSQNLVFIGAETLGALAGNRTILTTADKELRLVVDALFSLCVQTAASLDSAAPLFSALLDYTRAAVDVPTRTSLLFCMAELLHTVDVPRETVESAFLYLTEQLSKVDSTRKSAKKKITQSQSGYDQERDDQGRLNTALLAVFRYCPSSLLKQNAQVLTSVFQSHIYKMCDMMVLRHSIEVLCRCSEFAGLVDKSLPVEHKSLQPTAPSKKSTKEQRAKGEVPIIPTWEPLTAGQLARLCAQRIALTMETSSTSKFVVCIMHLLHHPSHYVFQEVVYSLVRHNLFEAIGRTIDVVYKSGDTVLEYSLNRVIAGFASTMQLEVFASLRLCFLLLERCVMALAKKPFQFKVLIDSTLSTAAKNTCESNVNDTGLTGLSLAVMYAAQVCHLMAVPDDTDEVDILDCFKNLSFVTTTALKMCLRTLGSERYTMNLFENFLKIARLCITRPRVTSRVVPVITYILSGLCTRNNEVSRTEMWCAWLFSTLRAVVMDVEKNAPLHSVRLLVELVGYSSSTDHTRQWKEAVLRFISQFASVLFVKPTEVSIVDLVRAVQLNILTGSHTLLSIGIDTMVSIAVFCRDITVRLEVYRCLKLLSGRREVDSPHLQSAFYALDDIFTLHQERSTSGVTDAFHKKCKDVEANIIRQYRLDEENVGKDFLLI